MIVLVVGDPVDGFRFYGPAEWNDPALEDLTEGLSNESWWYANLLPVSAEEEEEE